jgi:hypothetical protein
VAWIIDYPIVLEQMRELKLRSLYYSSGAFGFAADEPTTMTIGWIGPPDPTIKESAMPLARQVAEPHVDNLVKLLMRAWRELLPGRVWVMPKSHWAYELEFGSRQWMPAVLEHVGVDPGLLCNRPNAAAVEFSPEESDAFEHIAGRLLEMLSNSDFALAFPRRRVVCTLHSHKQIWWTSGEAVVSEGLARIVGSGS